VATTQWNKSSCVLPPPLVFHPATKASSWRWCSRCGAHVHEGSADSSFSRYGAEFVGLLLGDEEAVSLFGWLVADGSCWFVLRE
jgi:hypothetical protein